MRRSARPLLREKCEPLPGSISILGNNFGMFRLTYPISATLLCGAVSINFIKGSIIRVKAKDARLVQERKMKDRLQEV
jgi:hypothetical protein